MLLEIKKKFGPEKPEFVIESSFNDEEKDGK